MAGGYAGVVKTLSLDLRERILASYDAGEGTRSEVAERYRVSLGMVKKLLQQRRQTGQIGSLHHRAGRKAKILASHRRQIRTWLLNKPDMTLSELREALQVECTLPAIHYVLADMGLTFKKRRSTPPNKVVPTLPKPVGAGAAPKAVSTRPGSSSWMNPGPKPT